MSRRGELSVQCAWCRRFFDGDGCIVSTPPATDAAEVNHGIYYACLDGMLRAEVARYQLAAETNRLRTSARLAHARCVATRRRVTAICERTRRTVAQSRALREATRRQRRVRLP